MGSIEEAYEKHFGSVPRFGPPQHLSTEEGNGVMEGSEDVVLETGQEWSDFRGRIGKIVSIKYGGAWITWQANPEYSVEAEVPRAMGRAEFLKNYTKVP